MQIFATGFCDEYEYVNVRPCMLLEASNTLSTLLQANSFCHCCYHVNFYSLRILALTWNLDRMKLDFHGARRPS